MCRLIAYRGFESRPLRQTASKQAPSRALFCFFLPSALPIPQAIGNVRKRTIGSGRSPSRTRCRLRHCPNSGIGRHQTQRAGTLPILVQAPSSLPSWIGQHAAQSLARDLHDLLGQPSTCQEGIDALRSGCEDRSIWPHLQQACTDVLPDGTESTLAPRQVHEVVAAGERDPDRPAVVDRYLMDVGVRQSIHSTTCPSHRLRRTQQSAASSLHGYRYGQLVRELLRPTHYTQATVR